jgi:hypothetical protein
METKDDLEQMVKYLEDKIEDQAETIFNQRLEIIILEDEIRRLEDQLRFAV